MEGAMNTVGEILLSSRQIETRVRELGQKISDDYRGKDLLMVGVLKGAFVFLADLVRAMTVPVRLDFLGVASYGEQTISSEEVKVFKDLNEPVAGQNLLLVEDIIDSGLTTEYLLRLLQVRSPASIKLCTLLDKPARRKCPISIDYRGFRIDDHFVVGYGMDVGEEYRHLPHIRILKETKR
jgi:hypoxanthine phosphoribosyltransferase